MRQFSAPVASKMDVSQGSRSPPQCPDDSGKSRTFSLQDRGRAVGAFVYNLAHHPRLFFCAWQCRHFWFLGLRITDNQGHGCLGMIRFDPSAASGPDMRAWRVTHPYDIEEWLLPC